MNTSSQRESGRWLQALPASVLAVAVIGLAGCHTAGYQKSDVAAWNSEAAAAGVQAESRELEATLGALNELVNQPAADAKPQFLRFSAALDRLVVSTKRAERGVNRMWQKRAAYFQVWDKEIVALNDEEIRKRSQARKAEVSNQFDAASRQHDEAQKGLQSLIDYLQDIRKALSTDLTRQGLAAAQPSVTTANENGRKVQTALSQSATELDALGARTASFRVQEAK